MKNKIIDIYQKVLNLKNIIVNDFYATVILHQPTIITTDEMIEKIITERKSMARFGDGEFSLIMGEDLKFQKYYPALERELREILKSTDNTLLVGIPDIFAGLDAYTDVAKKYWKKYLHQKRVKIIKLLSTQKIYSNTQITRFYIDYADKSKMHRKVEKLKSMWSGRNCIIVEGEQSRLGVGNDLFDNTDSIKRIICPSSNAFLCVEEIEHSIRNITREDDLVLLALGPTATILAARLSAKGIQALDIGHIDIEYEWFRNNADKKKPVEGKYIGEIPMGDVVGDIKDESYNEQIVRRIVHES